MIDIEGQQQSFPGVAAGATVLDGIVHEVKQHLLNSVRVRLHHDFGRHLVFQDDLFVVSP